MAEVVVAFAEWGRLKYGQNSEATIGSYKI